MRQKAARCAPFYISACACGGEARELQLQLQLRELWQRYSLSVIFQCSAHRYSCCFFFVVCVLPSP
jgi:hypothetical protein